MIILVKREHIDNGVANSSSCCPIALACKDAGLKNVWVDHRSICYLLNDNIFRYIPLPSVAMEFVRHFDAGEYVTLFSFDLSLDKI